jgi:hypothetical protein
MQIQLKVRHSLGPSSEPDEYSDNHEEHRGQGHPGRRVFNKPSEADGTASRVSVTFGLRALPMRS